MIIGIKLISNKVKKTKKDLIKIQKKMSNNEIRIIDFIYL